MSSQPPVAPLTPLIATVTSAVAVARPGSTWTSTSRTTIDSCRRHASPLHRDRHHLVAAVGGCGPLDHYVRGQRARERGKASHARDVGLIGAGCSAPAISCTSSLDLALVAGPVPPERDQRHDKHRDGDDALRHLVENPPGDPRLRRAAEVVQVSRHPAIVADHVDTRAGQVGPRRRSTAARRDVRLVERDAVDHHLALGDGDPFAWQPDDPLDEHGLAAGAG